MALHADTIWEVRTAGNDQNSGGWHDAGGASADHSQQDADNENWSNLSISGTTLTDADTGGKFTASMLGNIINVITVGRFEITVVTDGDTVTLDRAPGDDTGLVGYEGGAVATLDVIDTVAVKGNVIHVKAGSYTPGAIVFATGDATSRIQILGYNASRNDAPTGDSRPLLACGANSFDLAGHNWIKHIRMTTTHASGLRVNTGAVAVNCKVQNTGVGATDKAFRLDQGCAIDCEAICGNGYGIYFYLRGRAIGCYVHDCNNGIYCDSTADESVIMFNIIDTIVVAGVFADGIDYLTLMNNAIYNCDKGVDTDGAGANWVIMNNIFDSNTTYGFTVDTERKSNYADFNNWYNNGDDVLNLTKGPNATANDPKFTNAAGGDFSLQQDSLCIGAGFCIRLGI